MAQPINPASTDKTNAELTLTEAFFEAERRIKTIALEHCHGLNEQLNQLHQIYVDEFLFDSYEFDVRVVFGAIKFLESTAIRAMVELHDYCGYLFDSKQPNNWEAVTRYAEQLEVDLHHLMSFPEIIVPLNTTVGPDRSIYLLLSRVLAIAKDKIRPELERYKAALKQVSELQLPPVYG